MKFYFVKLIKAFYPFLWKYSDLRNVFLRKFLESIHVYKKFEHDEQCCKKFWYSSNQFECPT